MSTTFDDRSLRFPIGAQLTLDEVGRDPIRLTRLLREEEPVSWLPRAETWLVSSRELVEQVVRDHHRFTAESEENTDRAVLGPTMLTVDGPQHDVHRKPFDPPMRAGHVGAFTGTINARVNEILANFASSGTADIVQDFAEPLGLKVVSDVLGFDYPEPERIRMLLAELFEAMQLHVGPEVREKANAVRRAFVPEVLRTLEEARMRAPESVLGMVANSSADVPEEVLANNTINLMFGGVETTATLVTTTLWTLLSHPRQLREVRENQSLLPQAIDESIRLHPAFAISLRWAAEDVELGGVRIPAGDRIYPLLIAANRDPSMFERPDDFDLHRANARQSNSFGRGLHFCIGQNVARLVGHLSLAALLSQLPGLRLDEGHSPGQPTGLEFHRLPALRVLWDRE
ncbi:cytochrome P450 [Nocardioides sp. CN2-186]|uniref:cytochrome P450 n=1 Tax=Nocardioides tweenelious TaxID=3156607 RepID=UPI0032B3D7AD